MPQLARTLLRHRRAGLVRRAQVQLLSYRQELDLRHGMLLLSVNFHLAVVGDWLEATLMVLPFLTILADILAWFLTKWDPVYADTVVAAGGLLGLAWAEQILVSLYQLWFVRKPEGNNSFN